MSQAMLIPLIVVAFVVVFSAMWFGITALLGAISGWGSLEQAFPDHPEPAIESLRMQSARMRGVNFGNCLRFDICATGLRVTIPKLLGPFRKPFFVPWGQISAKPSKFGFFRYVTLTFGSRGEGSMAVRERAFEQMAAMGNLKLT